MLHLAVLQILNLAYNAASLAAWMFYSIVWTYSEAAWMQQPSRFRTGITAWAVKCFVIVHQLWRCLPCTWLHSYSSFPTPVIWAAGNLCRPTLRNLVYNHNAYEINYESQKYTHVYSTVNTPIRGDCQNFTDCRNFTKLYSIRRQGNVSWHTCHAVPQYGILRIN